MSRFWRIFIPEADAPLPAALLLLVPVTTLSTPVNRGENAL